MILTFDNEHWVNELLRNLFASIDKLIYTLIGWIMEGIFNLSGLVTNFELARSIYNRIYVVLALFMVFKLTLSFLQYITNPESMTDKERGVGKLISRVVIMLGLLILFPILFFEEIIEVNGDKQTLLEATQTGVIKTLPKIILGIDDAPSGDASQGTIATNAAKNGEYMAVEMLKAFYYPVGCDSDAGGEETTCESDQVKNLDEFESTVTVAADGKYSYKYMWPLTTVSGIVLAVILIGIAVDVAIRVFKLLLLQLIAPVPIMSYIDPKSSKDGAFGAWIKSFSSTFLDIFIKLGTVYLLLLLFSEAFQNGGLFAEDHGIANVNGFTARNFVRVFLIIGLFKFAKDAPKFIKDALGMKDSGNGGMFGGLSTLGAAVGTIGGAAAGFIGGAAGGVAAAKAAGQNKAMGALKGLGGGLAGLGRGGMQGAKAAGKGNLIKGVSGAVAAQNAVTQQKLAAAAAGSTFLGRMGAQGSKFFTGQTAADRDEETLKTLDEEKSIFDTKAKAQGNLYDYIMDKGKKAGASAIVGTGFRGGTMVTSYDKYNTAYETAKSQGASTFTFKDEGGNAHIIETNSGEAAKLLGDLHEVSATSWALSHSNDAALLEYQEQAGVVIGTKDASGHMYDAADLKTDKKANEAESRKIASKSFGIKTSKGYKANKANADAAKKSK